MLEDLKEESIVHKAGGRARHTGISPTPRTSGPPNSRIDTNRMLAGNALIALGTLVLSSGGLLQGIVGSDESFAITLAAGIAVIYAGFVVASGTRRASVDYASEVDASEADAPDASLRRRSLPANERGTSSTSSTRVGSL